MSSFARPRNLICSHPEPVDLEQSMVTKQLILFLSNFVKQRFTRPEILFAFVQTPSTYFLGFRSFDTMIPRSFCSFSSFSGVLFRLYVKLVFGFILNTAHLFALTCFRSCWVHNVGYTGDLGILSDLCCYWITSYHRRKVWCWCCNIPECRSRRLRKAHVQISFLVVHPTQHGTMQT